MKTFVYNNEYDKGVTEFRGTFSVLLEVKALWKDAWYAIGISYW